MNVTTKVLGSDDLRRITGEVSAAHYDSNIVVEGAERVRGNQHRFKLGVADSRGKGARTSASGRHGKYLCWHGFRDVLAAIFLADPSATIHTGLATYKGAADFLSEFPNTRYQNVGSIMSPAYMDDLCDCWASDVTEYVEALSALA